MKLLPLAVLTALAACSEYDIASKPEGVDESTPPAAEEADTGDVPVAPPDEAADDEPPPADPPEEPPTQDEPPETDPPEESTPDTPPVVDDPPEDSEELFCTEFADFEAWSYAGGGDWGVTDGILEEFRGGFYSSVAYTTEDMGRAESFAIQVDVSYAGSLNDLSGVVWGYGEPVWYAVRWDDPQGDYGRHSPTGAVEVVACDADGCDILAIDSSSDIYQAADGTWSTWRVLVAGDVVRVERNGLRILETSVSAVGGSGIGKVGVYSNDNDGGVFYDNFCAWRLDG